MAKKAREDTPLFSFGSRLPALSCLKSSSHILSSLGSYNRDIAYLRARIIAWLVSNLCHRVPIIFEKTNTDIRTSRAFGKPRLVIDPWNRVRSE